MYSILIGPDSWTGHWNYFYELRTKWFAQEVYTDPRTLWQVLYNCVVGGKQCPGPHSVTYQEDPISTFFNRYSRIVYGLIDAFCMYHREERVRSLEGVSVSHELVVFVIFALNYADFYKKYQKLKKVILGA